jgi:ribosomal protein L11
MKPLSLFVVAVAVSGCASQPMPPSAQSLGESQHPVSAVSQCIAQKWANQSQQQVISQVIVANNQAMDVYVPGQQPPNGAAAVVRPSWTGNSKTWVGFRAGSGGGSNTSGDIGGCL